MMEQLDLFSTSPSEEWVFEILHDSLSSVVAENNVTQSKLICKKGKMYSSVWYDTQMAFRICCRDDHHYFGVSAEYAESAPREIANLVTRDGRSDGFVNFTFEPTEEGIVLFMTFLSSALDAAIDSIAKDFDCCSRYEECSNAKHCTNPNTDIATGCGYRKIMKKGKIFYGTNRNV